MGRQPTKMRAAAAWLAQQDHQRYLLKATFPKHRPGAEWIAATSRKAWALGCNPGGGMAFHQVSSRSLAGDPLFLLSKS